MDLQTFENYISGFIQYGLDRLNLHVFVLILTILALPAYYLVGAGYRIAMIKA